MYLTLALFLALGAWWTLQKSQKKSTLDQLDMNFAVPDTAAITKIIITETPGATSVFERTQDIYWRLNNKVKVAPQLMDLLLTTIRNVEIRRPVNQGEREAVRGFLKERTRKVEIFVKGELYKTYYVSDDAPENKGTYFQMEGGEPYVVFLRGQNGFLTPRYHVEEHKWRDHLLFSSTPETLQSVELEYPASPQDNFAIRFSGKHFQWDGQGKMDTARVADYLLRYKRVYMEHFVRELGKAFEDSLLKTNVMCKLKLTDIDKEKSHQLLIFPSRDPDRHFAWMEDSKELITIQTRNLQPLLARRLDLMRQ